MYDFVSLNLKCPVCGYSLMDRDQTVDNKASIHLRIRMADQEGDIYLSSIYGSYNYVCNIPLPEGKVVDFVCPHCHNEIISKSECLHCGAPMVPLYLDMGGKVSICSRSGCKNHFVEFEDLTQAMQKLYEDYGHEAAYIKRPGKGRPPETEGTKDVHKEIIDSGTFLHTYCPKCKKSLIENDLLKLRVKQQGVIGDLFLSPYLNVFTTKSTIVLPENETAEDVFCPHCGNSLLDENRKCGSCGSAVAMIEVGARTRLLDFYLCTRKGCHWHGLNEEDMFDIKLDNSLEW
ncbi:MAG TPA: zinc-ribbon domain-containing protein [Bacteroidales bacterium]|nr:zinc-ribbon domain-containing protein [Bacteroidales bacterium]HSA44673.1 zinc-ribbon domain-containing protein [Bacteroidales bacterium]